MTSNIADSGSQPDLGVEFWEHRYQEGTTRWDLGRPAPPLMQFLDSNNAPPPGRMVVLGMGRGHDALLFAEAGFDVMGVDFAPSAVSSAASMAAERGVKLQALERDIFDLPQEFSGQFDYVLEHTCFCAIPPQRRADYVQVVRSLLKPDGEFIGLFWAHRRPGGPPYGVSVAELCELFQDDFSITSLRQVFNSIPNRANEEYLGRFRLRSENTPESSSWTQ